MKTAVITGASSGLGREFVRQFHSVFPEIQRVWLIARRTERLQELAGQLEEKGLSVLTLPLDLCDTMSFTAYHEHLVEEQPEIALLVNNAGCGYLGNIGEVDTVSQTRMIDLNLRALTALTNLTVPYMAAGSRILNVSSIASFCPNPRMTVYSATKAYVSAYTIGAAEELKAKGITVTAVCPGPMATEFLSVGRITGNSRMFERLPYCDQVQVAGGCSPGSQRGTHNLHAPAVLQVLSPAGESHAGQTDGQVDQNLKLSWNCNTFRGWNVLQFHVAKSNFPKP